MPHTLELVHAEVVQHCSQGEYTSDDWSVLDHARKHPDSSADYQCWQYAEMLISLLTEVGTTKAPDFHAVQGWGQDCSNHLAR